jgi:hypothetical protein
VVSGFEIRVGDAEREAAATELREHFATGRLTQDELNERLDQAFAAKTRGDLHAVMTDLPSAHSGPAGGAARPGAPRDGAGGARIGSRVALDRSGRRVRTARGRVRTAGFRVRTAGFRVRAAGRRGLWPAARGRSVGRVAHHLVRPAVGAAAVRYLRDIRPGCRAAVRARAHLRRVCPAQAAPHRYFPASARRHARTSAAVLTGRCRPSRLGGADRVNRRCWQIVWAIRVPPAAVGDLWWEGPNLPSIHWKPHGDALLRSIPRWRRSSPATGTPRAAHRGR